MERNYAVALSEAIWGEVCLATDSLPIDLLVLAEAGRYLLITDSSPIDLLVLAEAGKYFCVVSCAFFIYRAVVICYRLDYCHSNFSLLSFTIDPIYVSPKFARRY